MKLTLKKKPVKPAYKFDPMAQGLSQSQISTRLTCTEKARLGTIMGWTPRGDSRPIVWGSCFHGMVETGYCNLRAKKPWGTASALTTSSAAIMAKEHPSPTTTMTDLIEGSLAEGQVMIDEYRKRWGAIDNKRKWILVEDAFRVSLVHCLPPMKGKFDAVYTDPKMGVGLLETKTKSQFSNSLTDYLPLDLQLAYYITALIKTDPKLRPTHITYNLIRRPGLKRGKEESIKDFLSRIKDDVVARPDHYFQRVVVMLEPSDYILAEQRSRAHLGEFMRWYGTLERGVRCLDWNHGACENKYGTCEFLPICSKQDYTNHYVREYVSPELKELE